MNSEEKTGRHLTLRVPIPTKRTVIVWGGATAAVTLTYVEQGPGPALSVLIAVVQSITGR